MTSTNREDIELARLWLMWYTTLRDTIKILGGMAEKMEKTAEIIDFLMSY